MDAIWIVFFCFVGTITCDGPAPTLQCLYNEVATCVDECPPESTCRNRFIQVRCAAPEEPCKTKCVCKPGLIRNAIGECIEKERCEQCDKPNEYYKCGRACDNECSKLAYQNQTYCPIVNGLCNQKCYCDPGYARDGEGNCIPISECPPQCADPNEENVECKRTCPPETCTSLLAQFNCANYQPCEPGCVCKEGYLRLNDTAPCMPKEQCPQLVNSNDSN